jgi:hypothetical protein
MTLKPIKFIVDGEDKPEKVLQSIATAVVLDIALVKAYLISHLGYTEDAAKTVLPV